MVTTEASPLERVRAQSVLLMLVELTAKPHEQIGELERLVRLGEPLPDESPVCLRCCIASPIAEWQKTGTCPFCHRTSL